jgi:hypothetical protein
VSAHRYWRLRCRLNSGDGSFTGLTEIQMRTVSGGSNVCSGGTAISTGTIQAGSAAQCFDGNTTTTLIQWSGTGSGGALSVGYDFGAGVTQDIVEIVVWPDKDAAARAFGEFDVQSSDDNVTWTTAWSVTTSGWVVGTAKTFTKPSAAAHRYWRIRPFKSFNGATGGFGIAEVEMKETVGGTDATGSGTASARTTFSGTSAANAFDNSNSTIYSHNTVVAESDWLQYDFGSGVTKSIVEVTLLPRQDTSWQQAPTSAYVESSSDGVNFLERFRFTNAIGGEDYRMRCIAPASVPTPAAGLHRLWGIQADAVQSGTVFGVAEIQLRATVGGAAINTGGYGAGSTFPFNSTTALPSKAYDGNNSTEYSSSGSVLPDVVAYDFGFGAEVVSPVQLKIRARSSFASQAPTTFDLVYSDDGQTWTVQQSFTTPATWVGSEERLFGITVAPTSRRRQLFAC